MRDRAAWRLFHERERWAVVWPNVGRAVRRDLGDARSAERFRDRRAGRASRGIREGCAGSGVHAESGLFRGAALPDHRAISGSAATSGRRAPLVCSEDGMARVARRNGAVLRRPFFQRTARCDAGASAHRGRGTRGAPLARATGRVDFRVVSLLSIVRWPIRDCWRGWRTLPPAPPGGYETEVNLAALDWIDALAGKLRRGVVLVADYGLARPDFYAPSRRTGTLQCYAQHRVLPSPLEDVGESDLTTHVEWTSVAERAEECGLRIAGFTDQHHFLTGLLSSHPELLSAGAEKSSRPADADSSGISGHEISIPGADQRISRGIVRRIQVRARCAIGAGAGLTWEGLWPD